MDLLTAYSKRSDLADALVRAVHQIQRARERSSRQPQSVQSEGKSGRQWRVADRLTETDVRLLVVAFEGGTPKWKLAEQYGVSESSVKRLLRRHRAEEAAQGRARS